MNTYFVRGSIYAQFFHLRHVKQIIFQNSLTIPKLKGIESVSVAPGRQLKIKNAFELAILGITNYHGIKVLILKFILKIFVNSCGECLLVNYQIPSELNADVFIFHMRD
jgi:hypothetical protein